MDREIIVIAHNIRSTHNVGAFFRTCDAFGVTKLILSGYTPYPAAEDDDRLPHIAQKLTSQINKTALGAETQVSWEHVESPNIYIQSLLGSGFTLCALEQATSSTALSDYIPPSKIALLVGEEVHGIPQDLLSIMDTILEIPMLGKKESLNVSVALGISLYHLRYA